MRRTCCGKIPQRWLTVFLGLLGFFISVGMQTSLSIAIIEITLPPNNTETVNSDETCVIENNNYTTAQMEYTHCSSVEKYNWNGRTQGLILSSFSWGYIIASLLGSTICQKFGGKQTLSLGILIQSVFTMLIPWSIKWGGATALIILRVGTGFGDGILLPAVGYLLAHWIPENERSKSGNLVFSGFSFGNIFGLIFSGIISQLSENSWQMIFYIYGGFGLVLYTLIAAFCYNKPSESPFISEHELRYLNSKIKNIHVNVPSIPWRDILASPTVWALFIAKFGNNWITTTTVTSVPKYMSNVLKLSVLDTGLLSSIPHLSSWLCGTLTCWITDKVIAGGKMSIEAVRKAGCAIAFVGSGVFLVATFYAGCDTFKFVALLTTAFFLHGCTFFSVPINSLDLSPNYVSTLEGLSNAIAYVSTALAPYLVGVITSNQTLSEWRLVFWINFGVALSCTVVFLIFGSGKVQEWNDPAYLNRK